MRKETHVFYNSGWFKKFELKPITPEMMDNLLSEDRVIYEITRDIILSQLNPSNTEYDIIKDQFRIFRSIISYTKWEHIRDKELLKLFTK